jgi:alpha-tubulin suppressor-like RCC1 family protein
VFRSVSAGTSHSCGLTTTGTAYCWGGGGSGQLGDGTTTNRPTPVAVAGGLTFQSVVAGNSHTCGVTTAGVGYCWGSNCCGELGIGHGQVVDSPPASTPTLVAGGLTFQVIDTRSLPVTCGLTTAGAAYCWGSSGYGDLVGTGHVGVVVSPLAVVGGLTFRSLAAGGAYTCGLTTSGVAYCWGGWGTEIAMGRTRPQVNWPAPVAVAAP